MKKDKGGDSMDRVTERNNMAWELSRRYLATQLVVIREHQKMSQKQLAKKSGVSLKIIKNCENPKADIGELQLPVLQKIALALGVRLKVTFEGFGNLPDMVKELLVSQNLKRLSWKEEFRP
jgi:transcriptional regulator with XRE-family HTH domain